MLWQEMSSCRSQRKQESSGTVGMTFRRGLATNLYRLGVSDKTIQRILRHANVGVTQACYIKTADSDATAAMQQFERSLKYAPSMHLLGAERSRVM
jgi:integrase